MSESTRLLDLGPHDTRDASRLLGMLMALAGEVFVLKAEVQRLRHALAANGVVDAAAIDAAGRAPEVAAWIAGEQEAFARSVMTPFTDADRVADVTRFMRER